MNWKREAIAVSEEAKTHVHVIKRNGEEVTFDLSKIENAIKAANNEVDKLHQLNEYQVHAIADNLEKQIESMSHAVHVEDIQDMVETGIMEMRGYEVAQKYVRYRYKRELARKSNTTDNGILALIDHMNEEVNQENSNKNPVINSKEKWNSQDTRDPKVFWYAPSKHWVLVLNERDGHSIYTSSNLKDWKYESHVTGFWECPELFELPVDGDKNHTKWVMYGATGTYMLGSFDGKVFTPEAGKYCYTTGSIYAAQTFTNIPASDGRRIQIGWGRISHPGMPFNGMMMLPTELTLRTTKDGIRLVNVPVKEVESLCKPLRSWKSLSSDEANRHLKEFYDADCLRIKTTIKLSHATDAGFNLFGQRMIGYDMNSNTLNGRFYSPQDPTSMELSADIYIDRTSIEVFIDGGLYSYSMERRPDTNNREGLHFWGNRIEVKDLQVFSVESIW